MDSLYTSSQIIVHLFRSKRWDAFHSPFLFRLFTYCCDDQIQILNEPQIEDQRALWKQSSELINRKDFGAGDQQEYPEPISTIARKALSFPFQCRFMARLAGFLNAHTIVEFGTSLGISTAYLASGAANASVVSIEGDPEIAKRAKLLFQQLRLDQIQLFVMSFEEYFHIQAEKKKKIDLLFLDGHHTSSALIKYYHSIADRLHPGTIIIVDDIYWSKDMNHGWLELVKQPGITQSVDCFHFGLLFLDPAFLNKGHHTVRLPISMMLR